MDRRDFIKYVPAVTAIGGVLATSQALAQARLEGRGMGNQWYDWPFQEIRVPYQDRFDKIKWPNNESLCVHVYVTAEWVTHRDLNWPLTGDREPYYNRDLSTMSEQDQYTFTVGLWRALRLLDKFDIKASIFPNAGIVERYPDLFRELAGKGHEIVARNYDQGVSSPFFTPDEERQEIQRATSIIEKATGSRPVGWINPGAKCTESTPGILADEGYIWHGDLKGDDLPYGIKTRNGKKIVVVPHRTMTSNDFAIFPAGGGIKGLRSGKEAKEFVKDFFDSYYDLGKTEYPGSLTYGIHPMSSCIPDRIGVHDYFFDYILEHKDVWVARYVDMAEHWMENYMDV